jgi:hypothetical protein
MTLRDVRQFLLAALECSIYIEPRSPGLTRDEIFEVARRDGFRDGEIGDALGQIRPECVTDKYQYPKTQAGIWCLFLHNEEPEYRNADAFEFVVSELKERVRSEGVSKAQIDRGVIVELAVAKGLPQIEVEAAITILIIGGYLTEKDGVLRFAPSRESFVISRPPSRLSRPIPKEARANAYPLVKDVIERRNDGRKKYAEPLDAFADELDKLGYGPFRLWWKQMVLELRKLEPQSSPVSICVLAAALVEGALAFVVKHARTLGLTVLASKTFDENPRTWKIDELVTSACAGKESAILDEPLRHRAKHLIAVRQRIHAGRMLSDYPGGPPDLRPEEPRDARETADLVVRRILDWLAKYAPGANAN